MRLRPPWILPASQRYLVGCLCELCHNVSLHLRYSHSYDYDWDLICIALNRALQTCGSAAKRSGNLTEDVRLPSSVTELLDMILCRRRKVAISLSKII